MSPGPVLPNPRSPGMNQNRVMTPNRFTGVNQSQGNPGQFPPRTMNTFSARTTPQVPTREPSYESQQQVAPRQEEPASPAVDAKSVLSTRSSRIRTESYTVASPINKSENDSKDSKNVRVFVGGKWVTVPSSTVMPSKKKAGTYIVRVDGKSVRLGLTQIIPYTDDDEEVKAMEEDEPTKYQVFVDGQYEIIEANMIDKHPEKHGFNLVVYKGHAVTIHDNFIIPLIQSGKGPAEPKFPSHYKVMITPEGIIVPIKNIQPDHTSPHMFVVLHDELMYQVRTEALFPIFENDEEEENDVEQVQEAPVEKKQKQGIFSPTLSTIQKTKAPAKPTSRPYTKPKLRSSVGEKVVDREDSNLGSVLEASLAKIKIPSRPKGMFPSKGDEDLSEDLNTTSRPSDMASDRSDTDVYRVTIKGETQDVPGSKISACTKRLGYYKVYNEDKWIYVKAKHVLLKKETTSSTPTETPSVRSTESRSPFKSPIAWDKNLRKSTKKNDKPRWRQTNIRLGCPTGRSRILSSSASQSGSVNMDQMSNYGEDPLDGGNEDECVDVDDALSVLSDTPPSVTCASRAREENTITMRMKPGVPILQNNRVLSAANAKSNMDWVKTLRRTAKA